MALFLFLTDIYTEIHNTLKSIYLTREQADRLREIVLNEGGSVPCAQDQVGNKVNAGVMDAVVSGGMCEGEGADSDEYILGSEGGNNEYFHVVNEDMVHYGDKIPHRELPDFKPDVQPLIMYKQFKLRLDKNGNNLSPGYVFPLYVNTDGEKEGGLPSGLKIGKWYKSGKGECWLDTRNNRLYTVGNGYSTDGNTLGKLAYRPGWHLTTTPWGNQRGVNKGAGNNYINTRDSEVWAKVEICVDIDATEKARAQSKTPAYQYLDHLDDREFYKYKTNSNATDDQAWYIVDTIRIVEVLDDDSVDRINGEYYQNLIKKNPGKKLNSDPYSYNKSMKDDIPYWPMPRSNGKRYTADDIKAMGYSPAEPTMINEDRYDNFNYKKAMRSISEFMKASGLNVCPYPKVVLNYDEQDGLFIKTGYYEPDEKRVVLFCRDRHPKDILRSFAHEMIHHSQNLDGKDLRFTSEDDVKDNERLEEVEAEAYLKGNIFFRKWTEGYKAQLTEGRGREVISPDDIDLSSFNPKKRLNPKFWKDGKLDARIRLRLLDIADDFFKFMDVGWVRPADITITGSLANYTWNRKYSDVDLHVIVDFSKVDEREDFVRDYFNAKKKLWNERHDIRIFGFPVEVYVQDVNDVHKSTGVYSLEKDEWIESPDRRIFDFSGIDKERIRKIVFSFMKRIDRISEESKYVMPDRLLKKANALFDSIKDLRKKGMRGENPEFSAENIAFKCLRRMGSIGKLSDLIAFLYDKARELP